MAEEEPKTKATRRRPAAKKTPAKPAAKEASASPPETDATPNLKDQGPPSDTGPGRPLGRGLLVGLAAVAIIAAVILAWPGAWDRLAGMFFGPPPAAPVSAPGPAPWVELGDRLAALEKTVAQIGQDIAALKSAPPPAKQDDGAALKAVEQRLAALASSVEAIKGGLAKPSPPPESGAVALMAMASALRHGTAFASLTARVRGDLGDGAEEVIRELEGLAGYAAQGVPTRAALAARLGALRLEPGKIGSPPEKARPEPKRPAGFWDKVKSNFFGLVKIRRTAGDKTSAADPVDLARAATGKALAKGDLAAAVQASAGLTGPEAEAWRRDLGARIAADRLALALDRAVAARLGTKAVKP